MPSELLGLVKLNAPNSYLQVETWLCRPGTGYCIPMHTQYLGELHSLAFNAPAFYL